MQQGPGLSAFTVVAAEVNSVFAELHPGAASMFQVLRAPETSFKQNLIQN